MKIEELTEAEAKEALKGAIDILSTEVMCDYCKLQRECPSTKYCDEYVLEGLLKTPLALHKHLTLSNGI